MEDKENNNAKKVIQIINTLRNNKVNTEGLNNVLEELLKEQNKI